MIGRRGSPSADGTDKPKGFDDFDLRLGDVMRGERATLGKSLLDVQRELKIKASYIAAIENADASAFETQGFVAGYVRSYARYLGMDPDWTFARFCAEAEFSTAHGMSAAASAPRPARPSSKTEYRDPLANPNASFVPRGEAFLSRVQPGAVGSVLVLMALIGAIGYGGWSVLQQVQRVQLTPIEQAPGAVVELDPLSGAGAASSEFAEAEAGGSGVALPGTAAPDAAALDRLYRPQALDVPVLIARDGPIAAITPGTTGALAASAAADTRAAFAPDEAPAGPGGTPVQVVATAAPAVELIAVRPSWVRVSAVDGTVIFEKILDAGERYVLPQSDQPPTLRAGNSGSVYFGVNGETFGPAAPGAQVVKNVVLSPDALRAAYALADLTLDADLARYVAVAEVAPGDVPPVEPNE